MAAFYSNHGRHKEAEASIESGWRNRLSRKKSVSVPCGNLSAFSVCMARRPMR
jgi:hypothetical protein